MLNLNFSVGTFGFLLLGLAAGILGGFIGIGGGIVLVPALVLCCGFTQHMAQGTSLAALLPPVGLLATLVYYRAGNVNVMAALLIAVGFLFGAFFGAKATGYFPSEYMQKAFGLILVAVGLKFVF